jgi:hypothetical protein
VGVRSRLVGDAQLLGEEAHPPRDQAAIRLVRLRHEEVLSLRRVSRSDLRGAFIWCKAPSASSEHSKMPTERTIVTREELFDLLWRSPLRDVARRLRLAPVSLKRPAVAPLTGQRAGCGRAPQVREVRKR